MVNSNVVVDVQDIGPPVFLAVFCHPRPNSWQQRARAHVSVKRGDEEDDDCVWWR